MTSWTGTNSWTGTKAAPVAPPEHTHWPVSVTLGREMRERGGWQFPAWSLVAVEPEPEAEPAPAASGPDSERIGTGRWQFCWHGLGVRLRRSDAETYWYNLTSQQPSLFVICREDPQFGLVPALVTLDQDESARQQESEAEIFSMPLPVWLAGEVERFVLAHYRPDEKRGKRRRKPREQSDER